MGRRKKISFSWGRKDRRLQWNSGTNDSLCLRWLAQPLEEESQKLEVAMPAVTGEGDSTQRMAAQVSGALECCVGVVLGCPCAMARRAGQVLCHGFGHGSWRAADTQWLLSDPRSVAAPRML